MTPLIEALLKLKKITKRDLKEAQNELGKEAKTLETRLDVLRGIVPPGNGKRVTKNVTQNLRNRAKNPTPNPKKQASPAQTKHRKMHGKLMGMTRNLPQESKDAIWKYKKQLGYPKAIQLAREVIAELQNPS